MTEIVTDEMVEIAAKKLVEIIGHPSDIVRRIAVQRAKPAMRAAIEAALRSRGAEPVAFLVHNPMIARTPVKARGRFPETTEWLYPASRGKDAREFAKIMRADCTPLYAATYGGSDGQ